MSEEKRFGDLLAEYKLKGMGDNEAMLVAADQMMFEQLSWKQVKDDDFEIIEPKQIEDKKP